MPTARMHCYAGFAVVLTLLSALGSAHAATRTWTGGGTASMMDPANWDGTAPADGDDLVFPDGSLPSKSMVNDFPANTTFSSITFQGKGYSITGGLALIITNGITCTNTPGGNQAQADNSCDVSLLCNSDLTCEVTNAGSTCQLGPISGTAGIIKKGPGSIFLTRDCTYTGDTQCQAGALFICESNPNTTCRLTGGSVGCGGLGSFDGECGDLICTGGKVSSNLFAPHHLICEDLTMDSNCQFEVSLRGTLPGVNYNQLTCDSCDLGGCQLRGSTGATFPAGTEFLIIDNVGPNPIVGTFAGIPQGGNVAFGQVNFAVSYTAGDGNDVSLTKVIPATTLDLTVTNATVQAGQPVNFDVAVKSGGVVDPTASGIIEFYEGATLLGSASILSGHASFNTDTLPQGAHTITAKYAGDPNHAGSTSNDQVVTITAPCKAVTMTVTRIVPALLGGEHIFVEIRDAETGQLLDPQPPAGTKMSLVNGDIRAELDFDAENAFYTSAAVGVDQFELVFPGNGQYCPSTYQFSLVNGSLDSDGDGYPDKVEQKFGSDPHSAASTPNVSNQPASAANPIAGAKVGLSLDYNKSTGKVTLLGSITVPENFNIDGRDGVVSIGSAIAKFHFDPKGKGKGEHGKDAATVGKPSKTHVAKFKGTFDVVPAELEASGTFNQAANKKEVAINVDIIFNDRVYHQTLTLIVSNKNGKTKATTKKQ